jgi:two-component system heavy metal sensor histidine kinase CusS
MFSKNVEVEPIRPRRWAMATWLAVYYAISVFILLAAASAFLYWGLARSVDQENRDYLLHKLQVVTMLLQEDAQGHSRADQEVQEEAEISGRSQIPYLLRVLDGEQRLVVETDGMSAVLPAGLFPAPGAIVPRTLSAVSSDKRRQRFLLASAIAQRAPGTSRWQIQAALNVSAGQALLASYRRDVALVLGGGLLIAALIGVWITRRGLEPIAAITHATERVGVGRLQARIEAGPWPRELVSLATAFDQMLDRLQEAFERLSQFSADLAHELRTPINNLMGEAQVALSRVRSPEEYARVLQSALEEHARIARMIDSMLFIAQADQADSVLAVVCLEARSEMQAVAEFYQPLAEEQGVELVLEGSGSVTADPMLLRRALANLLSNALKFSPPGSRIRLCVAAAEGMATLSVVDSGVGIAPEHLKRLGDRFYRADCARAASSSGAGLGLAIVKSIMRLHGGRLAIDSTPGRGTCAALIFGTPLPLAPAAA